MFTSTYTWCKYNNIIHTHTHTTIGAPPTDTDLNKPSGQSADRIGKTTMAFSSGAATACRRLAPRLFVVLNVNRWTHLIICKCFSQTTYTRGQGTTTNNSNNAVERSIILFCWLDKKKKNLKKKIKIKKIQRFAPCCRCVSERRSRACRVYIV